MKLAFNLFFTVVGGSINKLKTFEFNFDFYQALNSIDTQKQGNKEKPYQL